MSNKYEFPVLIERDENNMLIATVPSLRGAHTQARTLPTLLKRIKEVISLCLEGEDVRPLKFVGLQEVEVTK